MPNGSNRLAILKATNAPLSSYMEYVVYDPVVSHITDTSNCAHEELHGNHYSFSIVR